MLKLLDKSTILRLSRKEHYVKRFDVWTHLVVMLYAVIMRFDFLQEIITSRKQNPADFIIWGIRLIPSRSTLSYANKRQPEIIFEYIYHDYTLYTGMYFTQTAAKTV